MPLIVSLSPGRGSPAGPEGPGGPVGRVGDTDLGRKVDQG